MAIDGRDIADRMAREAGPQETPYSPALRIAGIAAVAVPVALLVAGTYWVGTWEMGPLKGGPMGGLASVAMTAASVAGIWAWRKLRRK